MANENYDELIDELVHAVEKLQKENFALAANQCRAPYGDKRGNPRCELEDKLARAEQRIADLREGLRYYERAESVTFAAKNQFDLLHGTCQCGHAERHAYASGYLMDFMATVDDRNVAKETLARDDAAAKEQL